MDALGNHILVEFIGCTPRILNEVSTIEKAMIDAAVKSDATVINSTFHHFSPYGVSGVVVIQESHLAIHTWPEYGYAAVDLFTCGDINPWIAFDNLKEAFQAQNYSAIEMRRGSLSLLKRLDFDLTTLRQEATERINTDKFVRNVWFTDKDDNQALSLRYTGEVFHDVQTPYQRVKILETYKYGKMLAIDEMVMTTEKDEFHYHEMIVHPAMFVHGNAHDILVIGGGDGGTVRELMRHDSVRQVTMVEIDKEVVEACKKYLPGIAASFDDPRLNLIIGDGIAYVAQAPAESYDVIIVDGSDPVGPAEGLFSVKFLKDCAHALKPNGIFVMQGESPTFNEKAFKDLHIALANIYGKEHTYVSLFFIPTYPTGMWSFQYGVKSSQNMKILPNPEKVRNFVNKHHLRYYSDEIHAASFALPGFIKEMLNI